MKIDFIPGTRRLPMPDPRSCFMTHLFSHITSLVLFLDSLSHLSSSHMSLHSHVTSHSQGLQPFCRYPFHLPLFPSLYSGTV